MGVPVHRENGVVQLVDIKATPRPSRGMIASAKNLAVSYNGTKSKPVHCGVEEPQVFCKASPTRNTTSNYYVWIQLYDLFAQNWCILSPLTPNDRVV